MYRPQGQQQQQQQQHQQQQQQQPDHNQVDGTAANAFYDSFAPAASAFASAVPYQQQQQQPGHALLNQNNNHAGGNSNLYTTMNLHHNQQPQQHNPHQNTNMLQQQQNDGGAATAWATAAGLPDDDDPLLQRRLQQLVEQHKPSSSSRNVLRELADVAEQQSTPSGNNNPHNSHNSNTNNKRKSAYDDDDDGDLDDSDEEQDDSRRAFNKRRKSSGNGNSMIQQITSPARKQMDDVISKRNNLRFSIRTMEVQLEHLQRQVDTERSQLVTLEQLVADTSLTLVDELLNDGTTWNSLYFSLVEFYHRHGHLRVPWRKEDKEKDPVTARLGPWLVQQRKDYRREADDPERLEPYKIRALEKLNIEWEPFRQHWFNRFDELKRYKELHGHCRVPYCSGRSQKRKKKIKGSETAVTTAAADNADAVDNDVTNADEEEHEGEDASNKIKYDSLGVWVKRQRNQYKNHKAGNKEKSGEMTEERVKLLESIGFEWSLRAGLAAGCGPTGDESTSLSAHQLWMDNYNALKAFKKEHCHTRVVEEENKALSDWTKIMRGYVKKYVNGSEENALTPEQHQLLKELEVDSSLRESKFEARFRELMDFKKAHGHCLVPASYAANQKLSNWVQTQKRQYKLMKDQRKSQMTEGKCQMLTDAGFEFEVSKERKSAAMKQMDRSWDELFAELKQYNERYGQINTIKQRKKKALREWCDEQRVQHARKKWGKESKITDQQIQKLSNLGFVWTAADTPSKGWDDFYGDLLTFFIKNQSFEIAEEDDELKHWIETQKLEYKKFSSGVPSLLTKPRVKKLNDVSFPWGGDQSKAELRLPTKNSWEEMFGQLLVFKIQNNHFSVPKSMKELRKWACQQRLDKLNHDNSKSNAKRSAIWEERMHRLSEVGFDWSGDLPGKNEPTSKNAVLPQPKTSATPSQHLQGTHVPIAPATALNMMSPMGASPNHMVYPGSANWATVGANPTMPHFMSTAAAGQLFMASAAAAAAAQRPAPAPNSIVAPRTTGCQDLASQAAQIVAATNSRKKDLTLDPSNAAQTTAPSSLLRVSAARQSSPIPIAPLPALPAIAPATTTTVDKNITKVGV